MPESNNTNDPRATVVVPAPETGAEVAVTSEAGGSLKFDFDPAQATATRPEGSNDLVFDVDGGGRVVIGGFFEVGDNTLPDLTLPDGTVVAATDFFAGSDLDLSTAAGPGAGAPGSGGTSYDDNGGDLLAGLDKYGMLGTDYWARAAEAADDPRSPIFPSADITIGIDTTIPENPDIDPDRPYIDGTFRNVLFEDGKANQHLFGHHGADDTPGELVMTIVPGTMTTIDNVAVDGFPAGTRIELENGRTVDIAGPDQVVNFTFAESQGQILIFHPADNSDADYTLNYVVTMSTPDYPGVEVPGSFVVVVDAVADLPELDGSLEVTEGHYDPQSVEGKEIKTTEASAVRIPVSATFTDNDGSELHYFIVENIPAGWTVSNLPDGWSVLDPSEYSGRLVPPADGQSFVIQVPYTPQDGALTLGGDIEFNPGDWTNSRDAFGNPHNTEVGEDGNPAPTDGLDITVKAATWEHDPDGGEITELNNYAETVAEGNYHVSIDEDTPEFVYDAQPIVISDESAGRQTRDEKNAVDKHGDLKNTEVKDLLAGIEELDGKEFISAATNKVYYDLKSDGTDDPNPLPSTETPRYGIAFDVADGTDSGWITTAGDTILLYNDPSGAVIGRVGGENGPIAFVATVTGETFASGVNDADITFVQYMSLNHGKPGDGKGGTHNESMNIEDNEDRNFLGIDLVVRDEEGDAGRVTVQFDVLDDGPDKGCVVKDMIFENDLRAENGGLMVAEGVLNALFGADGEHADTPVTWDAANISSEATFYQANIDGEWVRLTGEVDPNDPTTFYFKAGDKVVATGTIENVDGEWTYHYEQSVALKHDDGFNLSNVFRKLDLKYVVQDGDGDTVTNDLKILVHDSNPRGSLGAGHVDETWADTKTSYVPLSEFDYAAPDGLESVGWNVPLTLVALNKLGLKMAGDKADAIVTYDKDTGDIIFLSGDDPSYVFMRLGLVEKDGEFYVKYNAEHGLSHYFGGLAHNDALTLPLFINSYDGDGDHAPNLVGLVVTDDGPKPQVSSNVMLLDSVGDTLLDGLNELFGGTLFDAVHSQIFDEWHQSQGIDLTGALEDLTKIGGDAAGAAMDANALVDLAKLILNAQMGILNFEDDKRLPENGAAQGGKLHVEFGLDGAATEHTHPVGWDLITGGATPSPVGWSVAGVQSMFNLLGIRASQYPGEKLIVEAVGDSYPPTALHVFVMVDGEKVSVMELKASYDKITGEAGYSIEQATGLYHDPDSVLNMLLDLVQKVGLDSAKGLLVEAVGEDIANALLGALENPGSLSDMLGSGELLHLPLPYVTMDGDGDITVNLLFHTIRDSEPKAYDRADIMEYEQGEDGAVGDFVAVGNILTGEETTDNNPGQDFGFDGKNLNEHLTMLGDKAVQGDDGNWEVQGEYGTLFVDGKTGEYRYELTDAGKQKLVDMKSPDPEATKDHYDKGGALGADGTGKASAFKGINLEALGTLAAKILLGQDVGDLDSITSLFNPSEPTWSNKGIGVGTGSEKPQASLGEGLLLELPGMGGDANGTVDVTMSFEKSGLFAPSGTALAFDAEGKLLAVKVFFLNGTVTFEDLPGNVAYLLVAAATPEDIAGFGSQGGFYVTDIKSTYTPAADLPQESFDFLITDGDKDTDSAKLVINLEDVIIPVKPVEALLVDESRLDNDHKGTQLGEGVLTAKGSFIFETFNDDFDGQGVITIAGRPITLVNGQWTNATGIETEYGKVVSVKITATGNDDNEFELEFVYELTRPVVEDSAQGNTNDGAGRHTETGADSFDITIRDMPVPVTVDIKDDIPIIEINSSGEGREDANSTWKTASTEDDLVDVAYAASVTGSLDFTHGADGVGVYKNGDQEGTVKISATFKVDGDDGPEDANVGPVYLNAGHNSETAALVVETPYGDMKVWNDNGTVRYSFGADNKSGDDQEIKITFAIKDADGDEASDVLTLTVEGMVDLGFGPKGLVVDESYLGIEEVKNGKGEVTTEAILGTKGTLGVDVEAEGSFQLSEAQLKALTVSGKDVNGNDIEPGVVDNLIVYSEHGHLTFSVTDATDGSDDKVVTYTFTLTKNYDGHEDNFHTVTEKARDDGAEYRDNSFLDGGDPENYGPNVDSQYPKDGIETRENNYWDEEAQPDQFVFKLGGKEMPDGKGVLNITIEDDGLSQPVQEAPADLQLELVPQGYNVVICMDVSGSMRYAADSPGGTGQTQYSAKEFYTYKEWQDNGSQGDIPGNAAQFGYEDTRIYQTQVATLQMLEAYKAQAEAGGGSLEVSLTLFDNDVFSFKNTKGTSDRMTVDEAIKYVSELCKPVVVNSDGSLDWSKYGSGEGKYTSFQSPGDGFDLFGTTNWEKGLGAIQNIIKTYAEEGIKSTEPNGDQTRVYFMSDGYPQSGGSTHDGQKNSPVEWMQWLAKMAGSVANGGLGADFWDYVELHSVGIKGLGSGSTNAFKNVIRSWDGKTTYETVGEAHYIPDDVGLESFISELLGTLSNFTGYLVLPDTADGVVKQAYPDGTLDADKDPSGKAFVREVSVTVEDENGNIVSAGSGTVGGALDSSGMPGSVEEGSFCLVNTTYGVFMFRADGTYTFTANKAYNDLEIPVKITIDVTFMDADGDTVSDSFEFNILPPAIPVAPSAGEAEAIVDEALIVGMENVFFAGTQAGEDDEHYTVTGTIEIDLGSASSGTFAWTSPAAYNGKFEAMVKGNWEKVTWTLNEDGTQIIATAGGQVVMTVTYDPTLDDGNYQIALSAAFKHTNTQGDDPTLFSTPPVESLDFGFNLTTEYGKAPGKLAVTIMDDQLVLESRSDTSLDVELDISRVDSFELALKGAIDQLPKQINEGSRWYLKEYTPDENGEYEFGATNQSGSKVTMSVGKVKFSNEPDTLTAQESADGIFMQGYGSAMTQIEKYKWELVEESGQGSLVLSKEWDVKNGRYSDFPDDRSGLGIKSNFAGDTTTNLSEIGYNHHDQTAEAIVMKLDGIANTMQIDFRSFYLDWPAAGVHELLTMAFYRDEELVYTFGAKGQGEHGTPGAGAAYGNYDLSNVGGFDQVVVFPRYYGVHDKSQSDFLIQRVVFDFDETLIKFSTNGTLVTESTGADGLASLAFAANQSALQNVLPEGYTVERFSDSAVKVMNGTQLILELYLKDGEWTYAQYGTLPDSFAGSELSFAIAATDGDGDVVNAAFSIPYRTEDGTIYGSSSSDTIYGTNGTEGIDEVIYAGGGDDILVGGSGNDLLDGGDDNDILIGGAASKELVAELKGAIAADNAETYVQEHGNKFSTSAEADGNNKLFGGEGDDILIGGGGNDLIYGGAGDDIMFGGAGNDTFAWKAGDYGNGTDKIMDFKLGEDVLRFDDLLGTDNPVDTLLQASGASLTLNPAVNNTLLLTLGDEYQNQQIEIHLTAEQYQTATEVYNGTNGEAELLKMLLETS